MKTLKLKLKVSDEVEAYQALNRLARRHEVESAKYSRKSEVTFDDKKPKDFLKDKGKSKQ